MEFHEYLILCAKRKSENNSLRMGQIYWNVLGEVRPDLLQVIRDSEWNGAHFKTHNSIDPYYSDNLIGEFLAFVSVSW